MAQLFSHLTLLFLILILILITILKRLLLLNLIFHNLLVNLPQFLGYNFARFLGRYILIQKNKILRIARLEIITTLIVILTNFRYEKFHLLFILLVTTIFHIIIILLLLIITLRYMMTQIIIRPVF